MANGIIPYAPTTHLNEITCKVYFQALSWTVTAGSWSVSNGKLQANQNGSHIYYKQAFQSPNRHVAADIQTTYTGGGANVPMLMVNEVSASNMIYADIRPDGTVELVIFYNGFPTVWTAPSTLNLYNSNRIAVTITGTNAKVYVNKQLYIDATNNNFANITNGWAGFYTYGSRGTLGNLTVIT